MEHRVNILLIIRNMNDSVLRVFVYQYNLYLGVASFCFRGGPFLSCREEQ